jgi:hypothetical protein
MHNPEQPYSATWLERAFVQFGGTVTAIEGGLFAHPVQREVCVGPLVEVVSLGEAPLVAFCGSTDTGLSL